MIRVISSPFISTIGPDLILLSNMIADWEIKRVLTIDRPKMQKKQVVDSELARVPSLWLLKAKPGWVNLNFLSRELFVQLIAAVSEKSRYFTQWVIFMHDFTL